MRSVTDNDHCYIDDQDYCNMQFFVSFNQSGFTLGQKARFSEEKWGVSKTRGRGRGRGPLFFCFVFGFMFWLGQDNRKRNKRTMDPDPDPDPAFY